ncbi:MAG TPA: OmpA family protein [Allosphingosinicella sp.]
MPDIEDMTPGQVLADANVAEFIKTLGLGIAEAQTALDENSVNQIAHFVEPRDSLGGKSLLDLGLSPAFYHYQHADISCSLQISLRIEKDFGFDLNLSGNFGDTSTSADSSHETESETSSGTRTASSHREAKVEISMRTQGALQVGGSNFPLQGDTPLERIENLAARIRGDAQSGVSRVLPTHECGPVNPQVVPPISTVVTTPNTVAFLGGGRFSRAIIRIAQVPAGDETYTLKTGTSVIVNPGANLRAHADAVAARIQTLGYATGVWGGPGGSLLDVTHEHDVDRYDSPPGYKPEQDGQVQTLAGFLKDTGAPVDIEGYTDRSGPQSYNLQLGQRRGAYLRDRLLALGVPAAQLNLVQSRGEQHWADQGLPDGQRVEDHRIASVRLRGDNDYFVFVHGDASHEIVKTEVSPNKQATPLAHENGFIYVYRPLTNDLTGQSRKVVINGQNFPLRGAAAAGFPEHAPESYAANLAADINANQAAGVRAWREGNVVHLCPEGAKFTLLLVTETNREISMSGTDDVTVTEQFSRSRTRDVSQQRTGNRTVAVGASLGIRYQKQFEMNVSGNSTITARLVAIPAPPEFLATIKEFLS